MRRNRPAPMSSTTDRATCTTTSERLATRRDRPPVDRPPSLRAAATRTRAACHIGARLNSTPVPSVNAADNASTRGLKSASSGTGSHDVPSRYGIPLRSQNPSSKPTAPPRLASTSPSVSIWRAMRNEPAPRASRRLTSRCRDTARASSRFARFAQAMSSTRPTNAVSTISGRLNSSRRSSTPRPPGVSRTCGRLDPGRGFEQGPDLVAHRSVHRALQLRLVDALRHACHRERPPEARDRRSCATSCRGRRAAAPAAR